MLEFKVNEYITLKLEESKTYLYIKNEKFRQCMQLILQIPKNHGNPYDNVDSIDEAAKMFSNVEEREINSESLKIPAKVEFFGHCSNLQAWYENDYNTRLLHSELAFPLLHELFKLNDPKAKKVFKDEIAKRFKSGFPSVVEFLLSELYLDYLSTEEIDTLLEDFNFDFIIRQRPNILIILYKNFVRLGALNAKKVLLQVISDGFYSEDPLEMGFLFNKINYRELFDIFDKEKDWFPSYFQGIAESITPGPKEIYKKKFFYNFKHGDSTVINNLINSSYIRTLSYYEINILFENFDYNLILDSKYASQIFADLIELGAPNAMGFCRDWIFEVFDDGDNSMITSIIDKGYLYILDKNDLSILLDKINYEYILEQKEAFTIFKMLRYLGAPNVEEWYKLCIAKLIKTGSDFYNTVDEIIHGLLDEYSIEYIDELFRGYDYTHIAEQCFDIAPLFIEKLVKLGIQEAKEFYESEDFLKKNLIIDEIPFFLDLSSRLELPIHMCRPNIDWGQNVLDSPGITIVNKRIVDLNLKGCNLNDIPDSIGKLTQLKKINLLENCLNSLPSSMSNLKILKELELSNNQFDEFQSIISQLNSLEKLNLRRNFIEEVPDTISELSFLSTLNLRRNNLKILPKSLPNLKNLVFLDLSFNNLDSIPENINKLESLKILLCDYNNLKALPETIGNLMKLKWFHIDGNPLTSLPESIIRNKTLEIFSVNTQYLDETAHSILETLSSKNMIICSPPYAIRFDLYDDEYCFSPKDENTKKKFSRYINPERLPLTSSIIDKVDELHSTVYGLRIDEITPELCTTIFETFEEVKNQLKPNFNVILDEYFKTEILNQ